MCVFCDLQLKFSIERATKSTSSEPEQAAIMDLPTIDEGPPQSATVLPHAEEALTEFDRVDSEDEADLLAVQLLPEVGLSFPATLPYQAADFELMKEMTSPIEVLQVQPQQPDVVPSSFSVEEKDSDVALVSKLRNIYFQN